MLHNPRHPGAILKDELAGGLALSVTDAAAALGMSRVFSARAAFSSDLAIRLEMAGLNTARAWLAMQLAYDMWQAKQREQPMVKRLVDNLA